MKQTGCDMCWSVDEWIISSVHMISETDYLMLEAWGAISDLPR